MPRELNGDSLRLQVNSEYRPAESGGQPGGSEGAVTVGVVARNSAVKLRRLFQSLNDQAYPFELFLIDNASAPSEASLMKALCRKADFPAHYHRREDNNLAAARNDIVDIANGEFVLFLDSDVELPARWIPTALEKLRERPSAVGISGPAQIPTEISKWAGLLAELSPSYLMNLGSPQCLPSGLQDGEGPDHLPCSAVLYRRENLASAGGFDDRFAKSGEDLDLGLRLRKRGGHFLFTDELTFLHATRIESLKLWTQRVFGLGRGRIEVARAHPEQFRAPAVLLPLLFGVFAALLASLLVAAVWNAHARLLFAAGLGYYALFLLPTALIRSRTKAPLAVLFMVTTHAAYAWGEWSELLATPIKRAPRKPKVHSADAVFSLRRDVFAHGQVVSKLKLCELLTDTYAARLAGVEKPFRRVYVLAGWAGLLPFLLRSTANSMFEKVILVDRDAAATEQARIVNNTLECEGRFEVRTVDLSQFDFAAETMGPGDLVINTSMEHFSDLSWLQKIPAEVELALQASDLPHEEHLRPAGEVQQLIQLLDGVGVSLRVRTSDVFEVSYPTLRYNRVTLIGTLRGAH